jgi:CHAT domain-containing protein
MQICLERHAPRLETALVVGDARGAISERDIAIQTVPTRMLRRELTRAGAFVTNHGDESIFIAPSRETATLAALELKPAHSLKMDRKSESRLLCGELWALAKRGVQRVHIREEEMLVQARSEARNVAAMFHTQPLLDDAATKTSVKALLAQRHYDVIHFACHSEYDSRQPLQSSIWLAPDPLPRRDDTRPEHLSANECLELDLRAELVVISGCETGLGDTAIGDEVYGLPRALLSAGAASVLVSLWAIDDVPTMLLITRFYRELVEGDQSQPVVWRKAAALQAAQLYLRNLSVRETREYCHLCLTDLNCHQDAEQYERPFEELIDELADLPDDATPYADFHNWAPFVLVGCWN